MLNGEYVLFVILVSRARPQAVLRETARSLRRRVLLRYTCLWKPPCPGSQRSSHKYRALQRKR